MLLLWLFQCWPCARFSLLQRLVWLPLSEILATCYNNTKYSRFDFLIATLDRLRSIYNVYITFLYLFISFCCIFGKEKTRRILLSLFWFPEFCLNKLHLLINIALHLLILVCMSKFQLIRFAWSVSHLSMKLLCTCIMILR